MNTQATVRRNTLIRNIAALTGDIAVGLTMAALCTWLIHAAALGLFLSFLLWVTAALLALAVSQYIVNPAVKYLLSDRKLEETLNAASGIYSAYRQFGDQASQAAWRSFKEGLVELKSAKSIKRIKSIKALGMVFKTRLPLAFEASYPA